MATPNYAYFQGKLVPYADAKIGVMTHALNYGTACFGGVRAYWNDDEAQLFIFRPLDHYTRFLNSAKLLWMNFDHTPESLTAITVELLRREGQQRDMYIRPLAYKSAEMIGVRLHDLAADLTIFSIPFGRYVDNEEGAHVTFSSWRRVDDNSIPARGKISGSYVNSAFIKTDAMVAGYDEAIVLNQAGHISEGSAENLFMIRNGVVVTPPVTEDVLEGITRRTLMTLLRDELGLEVHERVMDRSEVYLADELWFCGTGVQVAAITKVDHRPIGNGKMGPVVTELRDLYFDVVRGKVAKYRRWNQPVFVKEAVAAD
jgi:branched-chain amino acid aminotransferase